MKKLSIELQESLVRDIEAAEDKSTAIVSAMEKIMEAVHGDLIDSILAEAKANQVAEDKGFRPLSEKETAFYGTLKLGAKQAVTADQIDIIPTETIDYTLNEVKKESAITNLINFAPANVKKWLVASKSGAAAWGNLTGSITQELTAAITATTMDVFKLSVYCVIPKAIRDLEIGYVDRYFTAILNEAMQDGIVQGYLNGDGKIAQTKALRDILNEEAAKGNYVIAGGDFNQAFNNTDISAYPQQEGKWQPGTIDTEEFGDAWQCLMDSRVPTCRSLDQPYEGADHDTFQYYVIDGFIVSSNINVKSCETQDMGFVRTDHNPVLMECVLK